MEEAYLPMTSITEQNKKRDTFYFLLGIILTGCLIQAAGWIKNDRLVFPDVREIFLAFVRLLGKRETYVQILTALIHLAEVMAVSSAAGLVIGVANYGIRANYHHCDNCQKHD